jgi:polar amino acid transport system substrate-binding protein
MTHIRRTLLRLRLARVAALAALAITALTACLASSQAQSVSEILSRKKIVIGVLVDLPPFGMMSSEQKPEGLDIDLAALLAKNLGVEAEIVPVATANRIPYLQSKRIDILVASLGITPDRAKQVMFTIPYVSVDVVIAAGKSVKLASIDDLKTVSIAVARGSSQEGYVTSIAPKDAKIMRFDGDAPATQAFIAGQAQALSNNSIMIASIKKANPGLEIENKITLRRQANAIAVRLDAFELHQWINTFIYHAKMTGELETLHQKWLGFSSVADLPTF